MDAELTYADGRGMAELIRMTLCAAKIPFKDTSIYNRQEFIALWPELQFNQLPLLRIDGIKIVQLRAIVRYVAHKGNLLGGSDQEQARVEELFEGTRDMYKYFFGFFLKPDEVIIPGVKKDLERYLPIYAKILDSSKSGFLVGDSLTIADIGLLENILATIDYLKDEGRALVTAHPSLAKFHEKMLSLEVIEKYIKEVRKRPNDERYAREAKEIFALE